MLFLFRMLPPLIAVAFFALARVYWPDLAHATSAGWQRALLDAFSPAVAVLFWLALAWTVNRALHILLWRGVLRRAGTDQSAAPSLLVDLISVAVYATALLIAGISDFRLDVTGALATSGILAAVIGFALRDTISDIFSGITASFEQPYRIGDWIEVVNGRVGRVTEISWRTTRIVTRDGTSVIIPNGMLGRSPFINYSAPERSFRERMRIRIDGEVPVSRVTNVLQSAMIGVSCVLNRPASQARAIEIDRGGITYEISFWLADYELRIDAHHAVIASIQHHLDKAGISLAGPWQDIGFHRPRPVSADIAALLGRIELFGTLDSDEKDELARGLRPYHLPAGQWLIREGETASSLFVLAEGMLEAVGHREQGEDQVLGRIAPGEVIGEISLLTGQPRSASVRAVTDAELFEIDRDAFAPLLQNRPALAEQLSAIAAARRLRTMRSAVNVINPAVEQRRLSQQLSGMIRKFFGVPEL